MRIIEERVRNRIMELLETIVDDKLVSSIGVDELVNHWNDFVPDCGPEAFSSSVYTDDERSALESVCSAFDDLIENTENPMPSMDILRNNPLWTALVKVSRNALTVFDSRGRCLEGVVEN